MLGSKVCRLVRIDSEYTPNLEQVASRPDERVVVARTLVFAQGVRRSVYKVPATQPAPIAIGPGSMALPGIGLCWAGDFFTIGRMFDLDALGRSLS